MPSLARLPALNTLNISNNEIDELCCLGECQLETLLCSSNKLGSIDSVAHLADAQTLQTVDLQNNAIDDPAIVDVLKQLPVLKCLYLKGNPVVSKIPNYRSAFYPDRVWQCRP